MDILPTNSVRLDSFTATRGQPAALEDAVLAVLAPGACDSIALARAPR